MSTSVMAVTMGMACLEDNVAEDSTNVCCCYYPFEIKMSVIIYYN